MIGGNLGAAVQMLKVINQQGGGSQNWESYWASRTNMDIKTRSGNVLVDSYGNNATIWTPYYYKPTVSEYASRADAANLLDVNNADLTMCGWIKSETATTGTYRNIMGKWGGSDKGQYGICVNNSANSLLYAIIKTSTNDYNTNVGYTFNGAGWLWVLMEVDMSNRILRFFVNNIQNGTDVAITAGTMPVMSAGAVFSIGHGNSGFPCMASFSDVMVYKRILTPSEKTIIYNRGYIANPTVYFPCTERSTLIYDVSGNDFTLTKTAVHAYSKQYYAAEGSKYCLDYGYTDLEFWDGRYQIPLKLNGTAQTIIETTQLNIIKNVSSANTSHNLADSIIDFVGDEWDRSNVTRFNSIARSLKYLYDAANPKGWHVELLNNLLFQSWANIGYKGFQFVKITDHSYKDRNTLSEILTTTLEQTGDDYAKAMEWANDYVFTDTYENDYLYWKMTSDAICAVNGNKALKTEGGSVLLSLDNGQTWVYSKTLVGYPIQVAMAWIFDNGNILFSTWIGGSPKMYLSTDNLTTLIETTVLNLAGDAFDITDNINCYRWAITPIVQTIGTKTIMAWANYGTANKNSIWYTTDNGLTIKQCYLDGTTNPPLLSADNLHGIVYTGADKKFWIWSGDGTDECNVIEGTYDDVADTWAWAKIAGDNDGGSAVYSNYTYYKIGGFIFDSGYVYWVSDSDNPVRKRIYRCLRADFGVTPANYETLFNNNVFLFTFKLFGSDMITENLRITNDQFHWILGLDKTKWYNIPLYNHVITTNFGQQFILGINSNGWIVSIVTDYNGAMLTKIK